MYSTLENELSRHIRVVSSSCCISDESYSAKRHEATYCIGSVSGVLRVNNFRYSQPKLKTKWLLEIVFIGLIQVLICVMYVDESRNVEIS